MWASASDACLCIPTALMLDPLCPAIISRHHPVISTIAASAFPDIGSQSCWTIICYSVFVGGRGAGGGGVLLLLASSNMQAYVLTLNPNCEFAHHQQITRQEVYSWLAAGKIMIMEAAVICQTCDSNLRLHGRQDTSHQARSEAANQPSIDRHRLRHSSRQHPVQTILGVTQ